MHYIGLFKLTSQNLMIGKYTEEKEKFVLEDPFRVVVRPDGGIQMAICPLFKLDQMEIQKTDCLQIKFLNSIDDALLIEAYEKSLLEVRANLSGLTLSRDNPKTGPRGLV